VDIALEDYCSKYLAFLFIVNRSLIGGGYSMPATSGYSISPTCGYSMPRLRYASQLALQYANQRLLYVYTTTNGYSILPTSGYSTPAIYHTRLISFSWFSFLPSRSPCALCFFDRPIDRSIDRFFKIKIINCGGLDVNFGNFLDWIFP